MNERMKKAHGLEVRMEQKGVKQWCGIDLSAILKQED